MSDWIDIRVNDVDLKIQRNSMLADYLQRHQINGRFLVLCNSKIVPKSAHALTALQPGDVLEIVSPISGG